MRIFYNKRGNFSSLLKKSLKPRVSRELGIEGKALKWMTERFDLNDTKFLILKNKCCNISKPVGKKVRDQSDIVQDWEKRRSHMSLKITAVKIRSKINTVQVLYAEIYKILTTLNYLKR